MYRRNQHVNIPIEIVRTVVAISETGSLSKAGERLGLSQPAISSQMVDNLNASIHLRALLTDLFLIDEIFKSRR